MAVDLKVPVFPESVTDGTLVKWRKSPGDAVKRDEVLADIETDKVVFEVPAAEDGVVSEILQPEGAVVVSGQVIARLELGGAVLGHSKTGEVKKVDADGVKTTAKVTNLHESRVVASELADKQQILSPSAKKLVNEHHVDGKRLKGSGRDGRVLKEDVIEFLDQQQGQPVVEKSSAAVVVPITSTDVVGGRPQKRVPMSRLRARIAERLVESQHTAAILTTFNEINMQPVSELRERYREKFELQHGVRLGFMSFFIKAVVEALKRFPDVNASVEDKDIIYHGYFDIGIAVGSPRGLVVPVLRDADTLGFGAIEKKIAEFGQRAKDGTLSLDEITGGTFSISNGGVFGSLLSTPIINPPQSGILGMHKIEKRPIVENDQIVIRPMMYVALSYDHRLIDGRGAVQYLVCIKELIEDPSRLLLEI